MFAAAYAIGGEKLVADIGNHLIPHDTECGKRANSILERYQEKLIAAVAFGLATLDIDRTIAATPMKRPQTPPTTVPPDAIQIIRSAPRLDGKFRDVYVVCGTGKMASRTR